MLTESPALLALLAYLAPIAFWLVAAAGRVMPVPAHFDLGRGVAAAGIAFSLLAGLGVYLFGPMVSPTLGVGEFGLSLRLDALSVVMFWLVSVIGLIVIHFSQNYLDGDPGQSRFLNGLALTLGAVLMLVMAGNLVQLVLGWMATSFTLHRLLLFYPERRGARVAARKKFIVARIGDVCLVAAAVLFARTFGTVDLGQLAEAASAYLAQGTLPNGMGLSVGMASVLVVLAAALKSAMFPTHGWLIEVMETPTPVSALLHAGLLNAGTFLVVRLGEVMFLFPFGLYLLILIGGFTALFASAVMITQNNVKVSLAYSSAAHMGFMLMLCGFGAHSVAIMHLIAHSFYKAHAFLSSGSVVDYNRELGPKTQVSPSPIFVLTSLILAATIFVGIGMALGIDLTKRPGETALGIIFVLATSHLFARGFGNRALLPVVVRTALTAVAVTLAFFALELSAAWILGGAVAIFPTPGPFTIAMMGVAVVAFGVVTWLQIMLPSLVQTTRGRAFYVHLKNGFYANALFDRLIGAGRV